MKPSPGQICVRYEYSEKLPEILNHLQSSLAITTYQAGKLAVVGVNGGQLDFTFHDFEQAMGIAIGPDAIAVGSRRDIHVLRPIPLRTNAIPQNLLRQGADPTAKAE